MCPTKPSYLASFISNSSSHLESLSPILHTWKLRLRKTNKLAQGHTRKLQNQHFERYRSFLWAPASFSWRKLHSSSENGQQTGHLSQSFMPNAGFLPLSLKHYFQQFIPLHQEAHSLVEWIDAKMLTIFQRLTIPVTLLLQVSCKCRPGQALGRGTSQRFTLQSVQGASGAAALANSPAQIVHNSSKKGLGSLTITRSLCIQLSSRGRSPLGAC